MRRLVAAFVCVIAVVCTMAFASPESRRLREPVDPTAELERYVAVKRWNNTVLWNNVATWNYVVAANYAAAVERAQAEEAARAAEAAAVAARPKPRPRPQSGGSVTSSVGGECTGGPVNQTVVQNESGGNPNARNSSGAWGCWQIMPGTWSGLGCEGSHGSASVDQQRECANKVYAAQGRGAWSASG